MGRPKNVEGRLATTDLLLAAATEEFGRAGYAPARLQDIAAAVGISRPSLLYHFGTKEKLYGAVVRAAFLSLGKELQGAMVPGGNFTEQLEGLVARANAFFDRSPAISSLLLREVIDGTGPGRALLLEFGVPILDQVEAFVRTSGTGQLPEGLPIRAAFLQAGVAGLVRACSGPLRGPLWGEVDHSLVLARRLFLEVEAPKPRG